MEKTLNFDFKGYIPPLVILLICIFSSALIKDLPGWWLPVLGGGISILGWFLKSNLQIDFGFLVTAGSFFYAVHEIKFDLTNLVSIVGLFFLFFSGRYLLRKSLFLRDMKKNQMNDVDRDHLREFKEDFIYFYLKSSVLAASLSIFGGVVAFYSFVGPFPRMFVVPMIMVFGSIFLLGLYLVVIVIPRRVSSSFSSRD